MHCSAFERAHPQPEGCFWQNNSRKQAPCLKDEHSPPSPSCIVWVLLGLRLLLLLFLGSVQLIKWSSVCLLIVFWSLIWNTRSPEETLLLWLISGTSYILASTNMIKKTLLRAPKEHISQAVNLWTILILEREPFLASFCAWLFMRSRGTLLVNWCLIHTPGTSWVCTSRVQKF